MTEPMSLTNTVMAMEINKLSHKTNVNLEKYAYDINNHMTSEYILANDLKDIIQGLLLESTSYELMDESFVMGLIERYGMKYLGFTGYVFDEIGEPILDKHGNKMYQNIRSFCRCLTISKGNMPWCHIYIFFD